MTRFRLLPLITCLLLPWSHSNMATSSISTPTADFSSPRPTSTSNYATGLPTSKTPITNVISPRTTASTFPSTTTSTTASTFPSTTTSTTASTFPNTNNSDSPTTSTTTTTNNNRTTTSTTNNSTLPSTTDSTTTSTSHSTIDTTPARTLPITTTSTTASTLPITTITTSTTSTTQTSTLDQDGDKPEALSSGSIGVIVSGFIFIFLVVCGIVYWYRIRGASYGRLLEREHGNMGNFPNPMYDP